MNWQEARRRALARREALKMLAAPLPPPIEESQVVDARRLAIRSLMPQQVPAEKPKVRLLRRKDRG